MSLRTSKGSTRKEKSLALFLVLAIQLLSPLLASTESASAQTVIIFEEDYESNNLRKWDETITSYGETVKTHSYAPYQGEIHGRFASDGSGPIEDAYTSKNVDEPEIYVSGYFYPIQGLPLREDDDRLYFIRLQADGQSLAAAGVRRRNGVDCWILFARHGSGWVGPIYASTPSVEPRWYNVELHWLKDSRNGLVELYIDGEKRLELNNLNTGYYGNVKKVNVGLVSATSIQQNMIVYSDLIKISSASGGSAPIIQGKAHGVTYMSNDWNYRESEYYYHRDFKLFKEQGITLITLLTHWQDFEPYRGYYNDALFRRMRRVAEIADEYGIQVIYNIHTTFTGYDVPRYVGNFKNVFTSQSLYNSHLKAVQEFCKRLDGPNVFGFQIHNEPVNANWGIPAGVEAWTKLFQDSVAACRQVTSKPISVRFASGSVSTFDDRIFEIFDFISINYYSEWHSEPSLVRAIEKTHQRGKMILISEFGVETRNDQTQATSIREYLKLFDELGVDYSTAWWYCPLRGPSSYNYNLFDYYAKRPRPAFYEIGAAN